MSEIKVSVIMPVYKVEDYLAKAIESMMNQTLKEIEIIVVDDGSPDGCGRIADEYAGKDDRITVIHKDNGGAPSARNAGIEISNGEYLYFLDPDDWAEEGMIETFYNISKANDSDLLIAGFIMEYYENGRAFSIPVEPKDRVYNNRDDFRQHAHEYLNNMLLAVPWNKLYRASYIKSHNLRFPDVAWDDLHFNMEVIKDIEKVCICSGHFYHFLRSRAGSETTKVFDGKLYEKRREQFLHVLKLYESWNLNNSEIDGVVYAYYTNRLVQCIQEIAGYKGFTGREKRQYTKEIIYDELTRKSIKLQKTDSFVMKVCIIPIKMKNVSLCIIMGKMISAFKKTAGSGFQKLKAKVLKQG